MYLVDCILYDIVLSAHRVCKVHVTCVVSELLSSHAKSKYSVPRRHYKLFAGQFICDN